MLGKLCSWYLISYAFDPIICCSTMMLCAVIDYYCVRRDRTDKIRLGSAATLIIQMQTSIDKWRHFMFGIFK